jgi:hypothetical protein
MNSGNSPLEPDFEELQSEYEDERTGQVDQISMQETE